ncbi:MAG: hypothetical protein ACFBSG_11020 [Leptolyngbyaceae cyanobacterium]
MNVGFDSQLRVAEKAKSQLAVAHEGTSGVDTRLSIKAIKKLCIINHTYFIFSSQPEKRPKDALIYDLTSAVR